MPEKRNQTVIVDISRPRKVKLKSECDSKKKSVRKMVSEKAIRKPTEELLRKYSVPGKTPIQVELFKNDNLLLPYRVYTKEQDSIRRKLNLQIMLVDKYKIKITELRNRLYVEDPTNDVHAVTDVDEAYFRYLNCIPLPQYIPLYKSLKNHIHTRLMITTEEGYRRDCILNLRQSHRIELQKYEYSKSKYMEQVKQFDAFMSDDYEKSMTCLKKSDFLVEKVNATVYELKYLALKQFTIQSNLIELDYMYYKYQKYGRFLYYLSPPSWRAKNRDFARSVEIEAKGFDLGASSEEETFNFIFSKMKNECSGGLVKPALYFSQPNDMISILESIEMQQFHIFSYVFAQPQDTIFQTLKHLKTVSEQDSAFLAEIIKDIEQMIHFNENKTVQLRTKFMKILNGIFFDSVAATDVLKLKINLDFCYEKFIVDKSLDMSIKSTAKTLEKMYMYYLFELETILNATSLKEAMKQCYEDEKKTMKRAELATRELRLFDRLERSLLRANTVRTNEHPLPAVKKPRTRKLKVQAGAQHMVRSSGTRELTEAEFEYLTLFTDWTEKENPANYLQSLI